MHKSKRFRTAAAMAVAATFAMIVSAPASAASSNWSGFYLGANVGYAWGSVSTPGLSWDSKGGVGGITVGYNWQSYGSPLVIGLEGDVNLMSATGSPMAGIDSKQSSLYTLRGRVGYAFDRFMPYVTGGFAAGKGSVSVAGFGSDSKLQTGWALGMGVEYALSNSWSVKGEWLHTKFGSKTYTIAGTPFDGSSGGDLVRVGLNYHF